MKNYEEMARNVLAARDEHDRTVQIRQAKIKRYAPIVSSFCFAVLLGFGVWHHMSDLPRIPTQTDTIEDTTENTDSITESNTTGMATERQTKQTTIGEQPTRDESTEAPTMDSETEHISETKVQTEQLTKKQQTEPITDTPSVIITDPVATDPVVTEPEIIDPPTESSTDAPTTNEAPTEQTSVPDDELSGCPDNHPYLHWDEMTINQQYFMAEFGDPTLSYSTAEKEVPANEVGEYLSKAYMSGYDWYELIYYHCEAEAYKIKGDDESTTIAIRFADDDKFYLYTLNQPNHDDQLSG